MRASRTAWVMTWALLSGACGYQLPAPQPVQRHAALESFKNCDDLEQYLKDNAVLAMRAGVEQAKQKTYLPGSRIEYATDPSPSNTNPPASPTAYTTTNTQVTGVDEADLVKTDGTRIYSFSGSTLHITQSWPAAQLGTVATLNIRGSPRGMFLDENNHLIVFSVYSGDEMSVSGPCPQSGCDSRTAMFKTTVVDVSTPSQPRVLRELYQNGNYVTARRVGHSVVTVMSNALRIPAAAKQRVSLSWDELSDKDARDRAFNDAADKSEEAIRAARLQDLLPRAIYYASPGGNNQYLNVSCTSYARSNAPAQPGVVLLSTLDLSPETLSNGNNPAVQFNGLLGKPGAIYASPNSLYVASPHWWWSHEAGQEDYTYLHKFDLVEGQGLQYAGSGGVTGTVPTPFSLDEKDGYLRVASHLLKHIDEGGGVETGSRISVLAMKDGAFQGVGQSEDLATGEDLYSARFLGNRGFLVTFGSVDPLYTFDLSDPTHPTKVGALTVPGYSTYLHPIDENHLLAIGEYIPPESRDATLYSVKVSLFDVSDFAHPTEAFTLKVGSYRASTTAAWDQKAFNYFPDRKLLTIPLRDLPSDPTSWTGFVSKLAVIGVDPVTGLTDKGTLSMEDLYTQANDNLWSWDWTPSVRRSVMADDYVYAISDAGIRVARVDALDQPIATTSFPPPSP